MEKPFYAISLVWNVLRRYLPENVTQNIRGMRTFVDMTGACFDVNAADAQRLEDILTHESAAKSADFKVSRAHSLPELKEEGGAYAYQGQQ
jgi:hypothetical protein